MNKAEKNELRQTFKSAIKASYFNTMIDNDMTKKSKIQSQKFAEEEEVDQNTFRINRNFTPPDNNFAVLKFQGRVSLQSPGGFFSCFGQKEYNARLFNSVFSISKSGKIKYFFDFNVIAAEVKKNTKSFQITFNYNGAQQKCQFYPIDNKTSTWEQVLKNSIMSSQGFRHPFINILRVPQYYKHPYVSYKEFQNQANTGDILFFRSQHSAARIQQFVTNSQYDHVAIVLRNKKNQLFMYESSSFEGVGLTEWSTMIKYELYKQTQKIAWRKLNIKFQPKHYNIIENFIVKTIGKQFEITFGKLMAQQSRLERKKQDQQKKTYFCSQLLARLYKELGFLDSNISCSQYYPVDFSNAGKINFVDSKVKLEEEYVIAFD